MQNENRDRPQGLTVWQHYGLPDYAPIGAQFPVVENSVTQVAPGPFVAGATLVSNAEVAAIHSIIKPRSVGFILIKPGFIGFFVPLRWAGDLRINGVIATPTAIHMPEEEGSMHIRGGQREQLACLLPRSRFVETVAALRGVDPDPLALHDRVLELAPKASRRLRARLATIIDNGRKAALESTSRYPPFDLTNLVFEQLVDAYLHACPEPMRKSGRVPNPGRIVHAAEERFAQAGGDPLSLADLCAAAGVSKSVLYLAFHSQCGEPPLAYFHKRRLTQVRSRLLHSEPRRGAVSHAALAVGLTELGRFSRDYRRLFGESPSVTLQQSVAAASEW
ncbi:MAG: helix-turn-helix transcriptional regulator [Candidatus Competibacteraceae bacterium]